MRINVPPQSGSQIWTDFVRSSLWPHALLAVSSIVFVFTEHHTIMNAIKKPTISAPFQHEETGSSCFTQSRGLPLMEISPLPSTVLSALHLSPSDTPYPTLEVAPVIVPILQLRRLRLRDGMLLSLRPHQEWSGWAKIRTPPATQAHELTILLCWIPS